MRNVLYHIMTYIQQPYPTFSNIWLSQSNKQFDLNVQQSTPYVEVSFQQRMFDHFMELLL